MAEFLGEAVLSLSTTDGGYTRGIDGARNKAEGLGKTLDTVTAKTGAQRQGMQQLSMQLGDMSTMYALGARPMQIFASQIGQITQAVQLMSGGTSKFAAFMASGWGTGITAGAMILLPLIGNLLETDDAAKDAKKSSEDLVRAFDFQEGATNELNTALKDLIQTEKSRNEVGRQSAIVAYDEAKANLTAALATRERLKAEADLALQELRKPGYYEGEAEARMLQAQETAAALSQQEAAIANLRDLLKQKFVPAAQELVDTPARADYERKLDALNKEWNAKKKITAEDEKQYNLRYKTLKADYDAAAAAERKARSPARTGSSTANDAAVGDMRALLRQVFGGDIRVADNAKHGKLTSSGKVSDHWGKNARALDFVVPGMMGAEDFPNVRQMLLDAGIDIRRNAGGTEQFFGPGHGAKTKNDHNDHYHLAWKGSPTPEGATRASERAADEATRRRQAFDQESMSLDMQLLATKRGQVTGAEAIAEFEIRQLHVESDRYNAGVEAKVKLGDLTRAQADELAIKHAILSVLKEEAIERGVQAEKLKDAARADAELTDHKIDVLHAQASLAQTAEERRDIELEILRLEREQLRAQANLVIKLNENVEAVAKAKRDLQYLDQVYDLKEQETRERNAGPLEDYLRRTQMTGKQLHERVQALAVEELEYFRRGITDAITSRLGIKDPLLAGLIDMLVQRWLIQPMYDAMNNLVGGSGGGLLGGLLGAIFGIGSGGSAQDGQAQRDRAGSIGTFSFGGFHADGGLIPSGTFGIVGERGPERIIATSAGAHVEANSSLRGGGLGNINVTVSGARGNAEIQQLVRIGVSQGIAAYDGVAPDRLRDNEARRR